MHSKVIWPGVDSVATRHVAKVGRNAPCPCGGGKKYKDCHEADGTAFLEKLARLEDKKRLKEQGVPWYKRFLFKS
jgi:hypothetical protein